MFLMQLQAILKSPSLDSRQSPRLFERAAEAAEAAALAAAVAALVRSSAGRIQSMVTLQAIGMLERVMGLKGSIEQETEDILTEGEGEQEERKGKGGGM
jgi:hypothetical protein